MTRATLCGMRTHTFTKTTSNRRRSSILTSSAAVYKAGSFRNCEASDLATAFNNRGQIRYLRVDFTEAVEDYTCAIQAQGQFEIPYYNRGLIHYRLGFYEQAKKDFEQTLKLNPDFEEAKVSLSQTLLDQHQKEGRGS
ncbi:tetratricopeptide repeat protein 32 isoform X2 [Eucyclogobius newberryi]|uniref:tetratricopeptide repeat protein 32 isoform X2 n=1 Tax=Eucyclogobius newberryi TaxID=166745 RepID=UPI003B58C90F